jgi:hypothetical protein
MIARRLGVVPAFALILLLASCGAASTPERTPTAAAVPLVPGSRVVKQVSQCDQGSHPYCAVDLVVVNDKYVSSDLFAKDESQVLKGSGWSLADGDTDLQSGANSPGHGLRLTYSTAVGDLREIDLGAINRPWPITYALSNSMFDGAAAMSMRLEVGAS